MANAQTMLRQVITVDIQCRCSSYPRVSGLPGDAPRDQGVHHRLCHHHPRRPARDRVPLPAVLQPPPDHETVPALEDCDNLSLLRDIRLQLPV